MLNLFIVISNRHNHKKLFINEDNTNKGKLSLSRNAKVPHPLYTYNSIGIQIVNENEFIKY